MDKTPVRQLSEKEMNIDRELVAVKRKYPRIEQITPDVLSSLKAGDHLAFNSVYMAYADPMLKFLTTILRDDEDAKEIVQEVFMNLWSQRGNIDPEKSIKNYLYTATRNRAFNLLRERNVRFRYIQEEMAHSGEESESYSHDLLQSKQIQLLIEAVVLKMPPQRRLVFEMSRKHGMSYERIAEELGITTGTVAQHITSALKSIKEVLALLVILFCDRI